jgi:hypothetical protein
MNERPMKKTQRIYHWTRDLHLYLGLLVSPVIVIFALSSIFLNHAFLPWRGDSVQTRSYTVPIPTGDNSLDMAKQVRQSIQVSGEIDFIRWDRDDRTLSFPLRRPGWSADVQVDLATGRTTVEEKTTGVWDAMVYMHKMPGPHNVAIRGNAPATQAWRVVADATVYLVLFLTATGIYLWLILKVERKAGLIAVGAGMVTFLFITFALIR